MTNEKFHALFGGPPRKPESPITQKEMDLARSVQDATEEIVLRIGRHIYNRTGQKYLCLAGGVALNCVANGRLLREGPFDDIWIQPAAGDAGGAVGAALSIWHQYLQHPRVADGKKDAMQDAYLGPSFNDEEIEYHLQKHAIAYAKLNYNEIPTTIARLLASEKIIGWFQGRMEFGPRALGSRSILGDARSPRMQEAMNLKIKFRESFRPFAPSILEERVSDYFDLDRTSPYMLLVAPVKNKWQKPMTPEEQNLFGLEKLHVVRSTIPAVTHVDYSARVQTVNKDTNPLYHALIAAFEKETGCPLVINTSFNVRGEPIVCTPEDAFRCFMRTNIDYLVIGSYLLDKTKQTPLADDNAWRNQYELD